MKNIKIENLIEFLNYRFDLNLQEKWDNSGLQTKIYQKNLTNIHYCLDVTEQEIKIALSKNSNFIISHHPLWINEKTKNNQYNLKIQQLLDKHQICVYSAHTNFDVVHDGLTYYLIKMLNWNPCACVESNIGLICNIEPISIEALTSKLKKTFAVDVVAYKANDNIIKRVAFVNGSGDETYNSAILKGCDVLITGDISYHEKIEAKALEFNLIDLSHEVEKYAIVYFEKIVQQNLRYL